jgi:hypothetical protein
MLLTCLLRSVVGNLARPYQVADRLMTFVGNLDCGQFTRPVKARQALRHPGDSSSPGRLPVWAPGTCEHRERMLR